MSKILKKEFIDSVLQFIASKQKLHLVKLLVDTSRNDVTGKRMGLKECKDFADDHFTATNENAELFWKFSKGKLK